MIIARCRKMAFCLVVGASFMPGLAMAQDAAPEPAPVEKAEDAKAEATVEQQFQQAMQLYADKDYEAALAAFGAIDAVQLSKEQQVSLEEAIADSQRQLEAANAPGNLLDDLPADHASLVDSQLQRLRESRFDDVSNRCQSL